MIDRMLVNMVISFALRQLGKFGVAIDWHKFRADADVRTRQIVPGEWLDDGAAAAVRALIDGLELVLRQGSNLEELLCAIAAGDWSGATTALKRLLLESEWAANGSASAERASQALAA